MREPAHSSRIAATPTARELIRALCSDQGQLMFVQSGGCGDGSLPICLHDGDVMIGVREVRLGLVEGCPFYLEARLDEAWGHPTFLLDVEPGVPEGISLAAGPSAHFVTHSLNEPEPRRAA